MANTHHTRSLPTPPVSLPAYGPSTPPSASPKPPVDSNSVESFKFSVPSPPYDKNAPYPGDTSFVEDTLRAENTPQAESPSYTKNAPVRMSAAQQLYASSFANRGLTIASLPPPTIDAPRRSVREQPSFYKNQVSSYVPHPAPKARLPDSARPSTLPNNNARSTPSSTHVRSIGPRAPTYSGNSVPDRSPRPTPNAPNMSLSSNSSSYLRGHAELDRPMITTDMPNFNRASAYTRPQETRNLFPPTHVETVKPRELRSVTTAVKPPPSFVAPQSITSTVERPPLASGKGLDLSSHMNMFTHIPVPKPPFPRFRPAVGLTTCLLSPLLLLPFPLPFPHSKQIVGFILCLLSSLLFLFLLLPPFPFMFSNNLSSNIPRHLTRQTTYSQICYRNRHQILLLQLAYRKQRGSIEIVLPVSWMALPRSRIH
jgi:hypothetical protein